MSIQKSLLTLPHSRLSVDGSVGKQLNVAVTTTNLDDLFVALSARFPAPGGAPRWPSQLHRQGHGQPDRAEYFRPSDGQPFQRRGAAISTASTPMLPRRSATSRFRTAAWPGTACRHASPERLGCAIGRRCRARRLRSTASIQNGDLADLLALAGQPSSGYSGQLSANVSMMARWAIRAARDRWL